MDTSKLGISDIHNEISTVFHCMGQAFNYGFHIMKITCNHDWNTLIVGNWDQFFDVWTYDFWNFKRSHAGGYIIDSCNDPL